MSFEFRWECLENLYPAKDPVRVLQELHEVAFDFELSSHQRLVRSEPTRWDLNPYPVGRRYAKRRLLFLQGAETGKSSK